MGIADLIALERELMARKMIAQNLTASLFENDALREAAIADEQLLGQKLDRVRKEINNFINNY